MATNAQYPVHALAQMFPTMAPEDYANLRSSISETGLQQPITIWQGQIVDGAHRYQACLETGQMPKFQFLNDDADIVHFVINANLNRRHMDAGQRAVAAYRLSAWSRPGGRRELYPRTGRKQDELLLATGKNSGINQQEAANLLGVNDRTVQRAGRILRDDSPATPELRKAVELGGIKINDAVRVVDEPPEIQRRAIEMVTKGETKTATSAVRQVKRQNLLDNPVTSPTGKYTTIVIDPPWPMEKIERDVRPNQAGFDYPPMTIGEIKDLPISNLCFPDSWVFLWTTQKFLPDAFDILRTWNLHYRFTMVWHKPGGMQVYNYPQFNAEFVLCGTQGNPLLFDQKSFSVAFNAPRGQHSEKPQEFYDTIARVTGGGAMLDMFNRRRIPGFTPWGNEAHGNS